MYVGGRYIKIRNTETGEEVVIDRNVSRYKRLGMGFLNSLKLTPRYVKHLTLTQTVESYKPNILNPFFVRLRRFYGDVTYIWATEVQEKRLKRTGDSVLHWHVIVGFEYGIDFGREDVFRLQKYWKYGNVDVAPVRRPNLGYLMKYISKSLDVGFEYKIRRIGSSIIPAYLRRSWAKFQSALQFFVDFGQSLDIFSFFKWNYKGAYISLGEGETRYIFSHPPSGWVRVCEFDFAPDSFF